MFKNKNWETLAKIGYINQIHTLHVSHQLNEIRNQRLDARAGDILICGKRTYHFMEQMKEIRVIIPHYN